MSAKNIFICYRRDDAEGYAGRLFDRLNYRFPRRVFMDVTGIRPGADFSRVIQDTVGSCHVLIAIIGRHWITLRDGTTNRRRLDLANDYVRREIATALSRNITVIPVLVRDAEMPSRELLPPDLASLSKRNALEITDGDFDHDVQRLIQAVEIACDEPGPLPPAHIQSRRKNSCLVFALGAIVAVGAIVFFVLVLGIWGASRRNTNERAPTPAQAVVNQSLIGRWRLSVQSADGRAGAFDIDIRVDGTYRSNTEHGCTYVYHGSERMLELKGWGQIYFQVPDGNAYVGHATLDNTTYILVRLAPR
ncbi:MAG TPA: toll/interleukin-1 receptor domain-containing protein [Pyrinomonadaceae bacterium]